MSQAETERVTTRTSFRVDFAELLAQTPGRYRSHDRTSCKLREESGVHGLIEVEYQTRTNNAVPYKTAFGAMCLFNVVPPCFRVTCCSSSYSRDFRRSWGGRSTFLYFTECIRFLHVAQRTTRTQFSMLVVLESSLCFSCPSRSVNFDLFQDLACTAV